MPFYSDSKSGFTLIELLVAISLVAILSAIGLVSFQNVRTKTQDAKIKSDINAISKAYEQKFDPTAGGGQGAYKTISTADFAGGAIPTGTADKTYEGFTTTEAKGFRICSPVMSSSATTCNVESSTCYCKTSTQGAGNNFGYTPGGASGGDFSYRAPVTITNSSGAALTNFQVGVSLFNTQVLIGANKMKPDCTDLRVTDSSGVAIPYWIESGCNSSNTLVWAKPASLATGANTIYFYYGNASATDAQEPDSVFQLFDDFNGSTLDPLKWTEGTVASATGGTFSVTGGNLAGGNTNRYVQSVSTYTGDYIAETRIHTTSAPANGFSTVGFWASTANSFGILDHNATSYYRNDASWVNFVYNGTGQWNRDKVKIVGTSATYYRTGETSGSATATATNSGISSEYLRISARYDGMYANQTYTATWDWILIRKTASTEPSSFIGSEQTP